MITKKTDKKRRTFRKRVCKFCIESSEAMTIDYKESMTLRNFVTERGKIMSRRITGTCAKHQRFLAKAIKQARNVALMPYSTTVY
ncbi:MAG: 30S ribosomal protein S18 [Deltaproteobacteria bacterium RIFOXYA12_FULL_61_11]|nr:MAG: 30S ribosomal protein S18 [Deltaproteobacteria bacterium RIFOXYA12_FULL_61_11]